MSFCTHCGSSMVDDAKFCEQCGTPNENYEDKTKEQEINQVEQQTHAQELQKEPNKGNKNHKKKRCIHINYLRNNRSSYSCSHWNNLLHDESTNKFRYGYSASN